MQINLNLLYISIVYKELRFLCHLMFFISKYKKTALNEAAFLNYISKPSAH